MVQLQSHIYELTGFGSPAEKFLYVTLADQAWEGGEVLFKDDTICRMIDCTPDELETLLQALEDAGCLYLDEALAEKRCKEIRQDPSNYRAVVLTPHNRRQASKPATANQPKEKS